MLNEGELGIFIPAMRAHLIGALVDNIFATTPITPNIYVMSHVPEVLAAVADKKVTAWDDHELRSWGARINDMYARTAEPYFFLGADDVVFHSGWYEATRSLMDEVDGVVMVADLYNGNGTLALVSRYYIEGMDGTVDHTGPVIHRAYFHNFSDDELWRTAKSRGRYAYASDAIAEHRHPIVGKAPDDEVYALGRLHEPEDKALFYSRQHLWSSAVSEVR